MNVVVRVAASDELDAHGRLREEGFGFPPGYGATSIEQFRDPSLDGRLIGAYDERDGTLIATLAVLPFGQYFGGRVVKMGGVGGVVVNPSRRGERIGAAMLEFALQAMAARGEVISALGPATMGIYRSYGWEIAGDQMWRSVPTAALAKISYDRDRFAIRAGLTSDHDGCTSAYLQAAAGLNGMVVRPTLAWAPRLAAQPGRYHYVVVDRATDLVAGYVIYRQQRQTRGGYQLFVDDLCATHWDAEAALWNFLGGHQSQALAVITAGLELGGLALRLSEQVIKTVHQHEWMLRLVDAPKAIAARGYPRAVNISVDLTIFDASVLSNDGRWTLTVADGAGSLTPTVSRNVATTGAASAEDVSAGASAGGPSAGTKRSALISVGSLAALYSGHVSARTLAAIGLLHDATADEVANLDAIFRGAPSVMVVEDF